MNYHEDCPHCGRRIAAYTVPLNRGLALAFLEFAKQRMTLGRPVDKCEMKLTHSQYGNFPKLRYFGLVDQLEKGKAWDFTKLGLEFFLGKMKILSPAGHFAGKTMDEGHLAWMTHKEGRALISLEQVLPDEWKGLEEYRAEKRSAVA